MYYLPNGTTGDGYSAPVTIDASALAWAPDPVA